MPPLLRSRPPPIPVFPKHLLRRSPLHLPFPQPSAAVSHRRRCASLPSSASSPASEDELARLLALIPAEMRREISSHPDAPHLVEVVMDLGRRPLARFPSGDFPLSDRAITAEDLHHAASLVGDFAADNRAGISRTLHRISAIRNRKGGIIGLTCRVGRAVPGSADMLRDLVMRGESLLIIGPPGVGKTTIIRDIARMLADDYKKRVMIVDTSNEIGGDGDIPHAGIGSARRLQVPNTNMQHKGNVEGPTKMSFWMPKPPSENDGYGCLCVGITRKVEDKTGTEKSVLIEAVENHMPQVIVIDEIGTKLEAMAASTIAQRGIQLVASAHGVTIENLIMNPSLEMLVGGIQSVTLGDEEASRRRVQKTVLERKGPSTFTCGAEIISKSELQVHHSLEATVDALLAGRSPIYEVRKINKESSTYDTVQSGPFGDINGLMGDEIMFEDYSKRNDENNEKITDTSFNFEVAGNITESFKAGGSIYLYSYGISETTVSQAIRQLGMDEMIKLTDNISEADVFLALHSKLKKNSQIQAVVKFHDIPVFVTKTSSLVQIEKAIFALKKKHSSGFKDDEEDQMRSSEETDALEEARLGIEQVVIPRGEPVQLLPRPPHVISAQISLIERYKLRWEKVVQESDACLRILPLESDSATKSSSDQLEVLSSVHGDLSISGDINGIAMLPFLPE